MTAAATQAELTAQQLASHYHQLTRVLTLAVVRSIQQCSLPKQRLGLMGSWVRRDREVNPEWAVHAVAAVVCDDRFCRAGQKASLSECPKDV